MQKQRPSPLTIRVMWSRTWVVTTVGVITGCATSSAPHESGPLGRSYRQARPVPEHAPVAAQQPEPEPAPAVPEAPLLGRWHGELTLAVARKGLPPSTQTDVLTFEIERGPGSLVTFWPNIEAKDPDCRYTAFVKGTRATFKPQTVCTLEQIDTVTTVTIRSGSLEQTGDTVSVNLVLDKTVRDKARRKLKTRTTSGAVTYSGTGTYVR